MNFRTRVLKAEFPFLVEDSWRFFNEDRTLKIKNGEIKAFEYRMVVTGEARKTDSLAEFFISQACLKEYHKNRISSTDGR